MKPDQRLLHELVSRIVDAVHPLRIILFGSAARGEMGLDSDLDTLVIMPDGSHRGKTAQEIYRHLWGLGFAKDIVVITESDIREHATNPSLVIKEALETGKELYRKAMTDRVPAEVFPPGEFIKEEIEACSWIQNNLAEILDLSPRLVSEVIAGKRSITPNTAKRLADAFGTSAQLWMNLYRTYQRGKVPAQSEDSGSATPQYYRDPVTGKDHHHSLKAKTR